MAAIPRYLPDRSFPPYTFVPGRTPHPVRDPAGHMHGTQPSTPQVPDEWRDCAEYLWGIDLFNHGYYWEAHEAWEGLWQALGRRGSVADLLKGLIKLAAAGVKGHAGNAAGCRRHATRAAELFAGVEDSQISQQLGLDQLSLLSLATWLVETAPRATPFPQQPMAGHSLTLHPRRCGVPDG